MYYAELEIIKETIYDTISFLHIKQSNTYDGHKVVSRGTPSLNIQPRYDE